ncbi:hypothetical protein [Xenorhabdus sp. IM139775]|uniref:hypothetical protein n=1 Tax=Xenorhabdus sp. IM139775 TaxID=3025876 RepID=UPI00235826BB|nr:hypothetical protein [Xenorhabdus sp. IM139775]MDC9594874.1 hypothetical protein [Xenorhabdus sp. IM139775]
MLNPNQSTPTQQQKVTISTDNGTQFPNNATLISGQNLKLNITISGGTKDFKPKDVITITSKSNWIEFVTNPVTIVDASLKSATAIVFVKISTDVALVGKTESFTVKTTNTGYKDQDFKYKISDIDLNTLILTSDKIYTETPTGANLPALSNLNRVLISTTVKDTSSKAIPNLSINISVNDQTSLSRVKLMDVNGNDLPVSVDKFSKYQYVNLITDSQGNLKFYIFPQQWNATLLRLDSSIDGFLTKHASKDPLFILDSISAQFDEHPGAPDILQLNGDVLTPVDHETSFSVKIPQYPQAKDSDYILFTVNGKALDTYTQVSDVANLGTYAYKLPYSAFPMSDKENTFGYILATGAVNILYSYEVDFKYEWNSSGPSVNERTFLYPTVYSSHGLNPDDIIPMNDIINYTTISQYMFNGGTALYVEVEADSNNKIKVNPGDTVTIQLTVNSSNRGKLNFKFPLQLPAAPAGQTTSKGHIEISSDILRDLGGASEYGGSATLYIDYFKGTEGTGHYSKKWQVYVDTVLPGEVN